MNKRVPTNALKCSSLVELELGDNGDNAKTAPVKMLARTSQPITHWYWGKLVHDMSGMKLVKDRIAIDYCHSSSEVLGYVNKHEVQDDGLHLSGAIIPFKEKDRASEVIHKAKLGVPYEASIDFNGEGIVVEEVPVGYSAEVNGYQFEGPGTIIREWPLRGVAICPRGVDMNTSTQFSENSEEIEISLLEQKEPQGVKAMSDEVEKKEPAPAVENPEAEAEKDKPAVEAPEQDKEVEKQEPAPEEANQEEKQFSASTLKELSSKFGADIAIEAIEHEDPFKFAAEKRIEQLESENSELKQLKSSGATPATPSKPIKTKQPLFGSK